MNAQLRRAATFIADHEFWLMWVYGVPLLFASNLPPALFGLALLAIPILWLARRLARGAWSVATPLDLPLVLLFLLGIVSVLVSDDRSASLLLFLEWVGLAALYYSVVNSVTPAHVPIAVWILLGIGLSAALLGLLGLRYNDKFLPIPLADSIIPRLNFAFLNPRGFTANVVAGAIAPLIPLAIVWAILRPRGARIIAAIIALVLLVVLILTQSRGALLGVLTAFGVMLIWRIPRLGWLLIPLGILLVGAVVVLGPNNLLEKIILSDSTGSAPGRLELWDRALQLWRDFPFTGIGLGRFEPTVLKLYPLFQNTPGEPQPHAHNLYLQMGVDYGIGGAVAFIGLVTSALLVGARTLFRTRGQPDNWLALGLFAGFIAFLVHGLLDAVLVSTKVGVIVWFLLGIMFALARLHAPQPAPAVVSPTAEEPVTT